MRRTGTLKGGDEVVALCDVAADVGHGRDAIGRAGRRHRHVKHADVHRALPIVVEQHLCTKMRGGKGGGVGLSEEFMIGSGGLAISQAVNQHRIDDILV